MMHCNSVFAGGMGKSTLACRIYNGLLCDFQGAAAASMEVGHKPDINNALYTLLKGLGAENIQPDRRAKAQQLKDVLERKGRVLLLLDNLWEAGDLTDLLPCVPDGSKILITTRDDRVLVSAAARNVTRFRMPQLSSDAAQQLFQHYTRISNTPEALQV